MNYDTEFKPGTKVVGNWGAMHPMSYGEVTDVWTTYGGVRRGKVTEANIRWEDGTWGVHEIKASKGVNGGNIGVWVNEVETV